jgi:hypothetical protein
MSIASVAAMVVVKCRIERFKRERGHVSFESSRWRKKEDWSG